MTPLGQQEHWHVIAWDLVGDVYQLTIGQPVIEIVQVADLVGKDGGPLERRELVRFDNVQTILFAADEKKYTHHAGKKLKPEKILERHMKAVAAAFATTVAVEQDNERVGTGVDLEIKPEGKVK